MGTRLFANKCGLHYFSFYILRPLTKDFQRKMSSELTSIEHGCFDTAALQMELAQALEEDRTYKLTDNMKKRAIHTASSYDEFKVHPIFRFRCVLEA